MKTSLFHGKAIIPLLMVALMGSCLGDTIKDLENAYLARYDEANGKRKTQLEKLQDSYLTALKREMGKAQARGKLETVIPYRDEIQYVNDGKDPLPKLPAATNYQLKEMRGKFVEARQTIVKNHATSLIVLADKMVKVLEQREADFTKAGKIDEAIAARNVRETYGEDEEIQAARNLLKFAGGQEAAPAAVQLRRSGDNLEVLVRYDSKGKVSMDSPVENIREQTGKGEELGDTTATVLGEFVGAEGYEVDPWVAFHQVFDGDIPATFSLREMVGEPKSQEDEQVGLRLSYKVKATNPYVSLGPVLSPKSSPSAFKISCRYFVPESNQSLSGLSFVQSSGRPIGSGRLEERGKWAFGKLTGSPTSDSAVLLMYVTVGEGKKKTDIPEDYVTVGEIKIEHTSFTAHLHTRFGQSGAVEQRLDDPAKQPVVVSMGELQED
ncbi:hypothetical protein [Haloferula sp.]|uniref:hypothetical protein n=1 Tax=Haloferula sp. TaxID=2497595 RepID=UPI00329FBAE9